jgi:hypothetical protein
MLAPLRYLLPAASTLIRPDTPAGRLNGSQWLFIYQSLTDSLNKQGLVPCSSVFPKHLSFCSSAPLPSVLHPSNLGPYFHPTSASAVWALNNVACFLVRPVCGLAGESGPLPRAECRGGMQGSCCLRSTLAVCPGDKPRSEFTTRPPRYSDKGTHAQRGQGTRQDKPHTGLTRKLSTPLTQSPNGTSRRKP